MYFLYFLYFLLGSIPIGTIKFIAQEAIVYRLLHGKDVVGSSEVMDEFGSLAN
jgi:hypothetical protein